MKIASGVTIQEGNASKEGPPLKPTTMTKKDYQAVCHTHAHTCIHPCAHMGIHPRAHTCIHLRAHTCIHPHAHTAMHRHTHARARSIGAVCAHTTHFYAHTHGHAHICACVCTYKRTPRIYVHHTYAFIWLYYITPFRFRNCLMPLPTTPPQWMESHYPYCNRGSNNHSTSNNTYHNTNKYACSHQHYRLSCCTTLHMLGSLTVIM